MYYISVLIKQSEVNNTVSTDNKKGRPFSGAEPLTKDLKVRVSDNTYKQLLAHSKFEKITVAEVVRKAIKAFIKK